MRRFIVLAMLIGCALAASVDRVRRDDNDEESSESLNREFRERRDTPEACSFTKWANGIVCYTFDSNVQSDTTLRNMYLKVFYRIMNVSCVRFVASTENECESVAAIPVQVVEQDGGCWAHVGCSLSQPTSISMASNCYSYGVIMHEVFHALGRFHEQTRQDRDNELIVQWENIISNKQGNYQMCTRDLFDVPYDFQSIMHYSDQHFIESGANATMTIIDIDAKYNQKLMGLQGKMSFRDIETLNKMYSCYETSMDIHCAHGGIKASNGTCLCNVPFIGENCENVDTTKGVEVPVGDSDFIASNGFPGTYPSDTNIYYVLKCPVGERVRVDFDEFDIEAYGCGYDYFQDFKSGGDIYGEKMCGTSMRGQIVESNDNFMVIYFYADDLYQYTGFEAGISCV